MPLNDCGDGGGLLIVDSSYAVPGMSLLGTTLTQGEVKVPALRVVWTVIDSIYVTHVEIELQPTDLSSPATVERAPKEDLGRTITNGVVAGKDLTVRYRAAGPGAYGPWSAPQSVPIPAVMVSSDVATTSVVATSLSTLTGTVGSHTTSISTFASLFLDIEGNLQNAWGVRFDGGGRFSGMELLQVGGPSTVVTTLRLYVDALLMFNPQTGVDEPFLRADATGLFVGNDRVVTESVGVGQMSKGYIATLPSDLNWPTTAGVTQTVFNLGGVVKDRADSDMRVQINVTNRAGDDYLHAYRLTFTPAVGSPTVMTYVPQHAQPDITIGSVGTTARSNVAVLWIATGLAAGTYTVKLEVTHTTGWVAGQGYFQSGTLMEVREAKRAA